MPVRRTTIRANDLTFEALSAGSRQGELVLLLHGFPQSAECWRDALTSLADAGYEAVAVNQRGYSPGARPESVDAYRIREVTADALAVVRALGRERFHVIGHDWGGVVAWVLAAERADALASVTSLSTPHPTAIGTALRGYQQRARMTYIPVLRTPVLAESLLNAAGGRLAERLFTMTGLERSRAHRDIQHLLRVGPTGPLNWYRAMGGERLNDDARITVPALYVWSDRDPAFGREAAELTEQYVDAPYHFVELQGASHWLPDQHWHDVDDLVLSHLADNPVHNARRGR